MLDTTVTFIHAADLHLDSPFQGLAHVPEHLFSKIRQSTFHAFNNLIREAIERQVDFIVLVGDLFDNEKQSLKAQVHLRNGFEKLREHGIYAYLSYGNHDFIKGNIHPINYPDNVFVFEREDVSAFVYKDLAKIYGFSYENRAVLENKSEQFVKNDEHIPFHIGLLHGTVYGNQDHDLYAPFQLNELKNKMFDYWALGHIHKREILSENPPIVYSGNIQGRHRKETGEKGCYVVSLTKNDVQLHFIPLQTIMFEEIIIDLTNCQSIHDVEPLIYENIVHKQCAQLIYITFTSRSDNMYKWEEERLIDELIDIVNESFIYKNPWIFIYRYKVKRETISVARMNDFFMNEYVRTVDQLNVREMMNQLLNHRQGKKYVTSFTEDEQNEIKERAKQLMMTEFFKGKD